MSKRIFKKNLKTSQFRPYKPSKRMIQELETFLECVPPDRLSRRLRNLFLEFLPYYVKDSIPSDLNDTATDLYFLFEFLDKAGEEINEYSNSKLKN